MILLAPKPIGAFKPDEWLDYVKSMWASNSQSKTASKRVMGVSLSFGKRTTIRIKRDPKHVIESELTLLADEYGKTVEELRALFTKRKIDIRPG